MLEQATQALTRLDAQALDQITERALTTIEKLQEEIKAMPLPEVAARLRLFAQLIEATGRQLDILLPQKSLSDERSGVDVWAR